MEITPRPPTNNTLENLVALNTAWRLFRTAETEEEEQRADLDFAQLYDWFTEHNISIVYIRQTKLYTLSGEQDPSVQTNGKP